MGPNAPRRHYGCNPSRAWARTRSHDDGFLSSLRSGRAYAPYSLQGFTSRTSPGSQHQHGLSHGSSFPRRRLYSAPQFGQAGWYGMSPSASLHGTVPGPTNGIHHPLSTPTSFTPNVSTSLDSGTLSVTAEHREEWAWNPAGELCRSTPYSFQVHHINVSSWLCPTSLVAWCLIVHT